MSSPGFEQADPDFLHEHVYQGIWTNFNEPRYRARIWTLQSHKVFFVMAALAVLVAFTGSRSWNILRYIVLRMTGLPARFPEDAHREPLRNLSQGAAISNSWPHAVEPVIRFKHSLTRRSRPLYRSRSGVAPRHDPAQSMWLGILAVFNIVLYISMGVAIPALLTDGAFGAPVVKTAATEKCLSSNYIAGVAMSLYVLPITDALFRLCYDDVDNSCNSQYYLSPSQIIKTRLDTCPFPGDVCLRGTKPFEISHMNISAYELGINSPSRLTLNHRLTCAPVETEKFQLFPGPTNGYAPNASIISARTTLDSQSNRYYHVWANFSMVLNTLNGPNSRSSESSGLLMARKNGAVDVTVLPKDWVSRWSTISGYQKYIHQDLRRNDGKSFLIVNRLGNTRTWNTSVDDPFFAAHNYYKVEGMPVPIYLPDQEATALGCIEKYQFCMPTLAGQRYCTGWGPSRQAFTELSRAVRLIDPQLTYLAFYDWHAFMAAVPNALAVYDYLAMRNAFSDHLPLLRDQTSANRWLDEGVEPWTLEVETWLMKAILGGIFRVRMGARYHFTNFSTINLRGLGFKSEEEFAQKWATCGRVLFRDGDFTNIYWDGFCLTTAALLSICLISYIGIVMKLARAGWRAICRIARALAMGCARCWKDSKAAIVRLWSKWIEIRRDRTAQRSTVQSSSHRVERSYDSVGGDVGMNVLRVVETDIDSDDPDNTL